MTDQLLGFAVYAGYGVVVVLALVLAVIVFRTGDGERDRRDTGGGVGHRSRSWWRRWR
ncbi:hypothetical protein BH23ACT1_BH23ACT1_14490 [soil metagenome]|jgi:hypothetical protein